ncbi:hypothetical protein COLU111180_02850 [Cohnella lubricantis]|nr:hypothetical protein [Cohnella lubricantis]
MHVMNTLLICPRLKFIISTHNTYKLTVLEVDYCISISLALT